jgi:rubrerythrin
MAEVSFRNAMAVEEIHYSLYSQALAAVKAGGDLPARPVYVCEVCGNTVYDSAQDKCDICGVPKERFTLIS